MLYELSSTITALDFARVPAASVHLAERMGLARAIASNAIMSIRSTRIRISLMRKRLSFLRRSASKKCTCEKSTTLACLLLHRWIISGMPAAKTPRRRNGLIKLNVASSCAWRDTTRGHSQKEQMYPSGRSQWSLPCTHFCIHRSGRLCVSDTHFV